MDDLAFELIRLAAEHKWEKPKKKAKTVKAGSSSTFLSEQAVSGSQGQSSSVGSSAGSKGLHQKRSREEPMTTFVDLSEGEGGFVLPACLTNRNFFDKTLPRLTETALVLNEGGPTHEAENDMLDLQGKQENYFKNMEEAWFTAEKHEKTSQMLEELKASSVEERKKLEEDMADLQARLTPAADETIDTLKFSSRTELVKEIKRLVGKMVKSMVYGWKNVVAQLKIVNSEHGLITEGIQKLKKVEKGQIVIPEDYKKMALEEDEDDDDEEEDGEEEDAEEGKGPGRS
ncbi:unnamed protein product [Trifolium pratense]|nr:unnamed protein product [Trifolium pratense]